MKSAILLSLILSLSVACSSTPDASEMENPAPEAELPASVTAKPETDVKEKAAGEATDIAAAVDAKLEAKAEAAPAPAVEAAPVASAEKLVYPTATLVNVRQGPGKSHAVARIAKFGEAISLTGEQKNTWLKTTDGLWVSSLFTSETKPEQANDPVVQAAPVAEVQAAQPVEQVAEPVAAPAAEEATAPATP